MTDTNAQNPGNVTTIVIAKPPKIVAAAFFLTLLFGPLGLLYASIGGGIFLTICAVIFVPLTAGVAAILLWPASIIWGVIAAILSKSKTTKGG